MISDCFDNSSDVFWFAVCMQFGYVMLFSTVWPLIPLFAWTNNVYEVRGDVLRLCYASRRPLPRKATDLGRWESFFVFVVIISAVVTTGLISVSTGHLESFFIDCNQTGNEKGRFGPVMTCFETWGVRLSIAAVIEHCILFCQLIILTGITNYPRWVQRRKRQMEKQTMHTLADLATR